MAQTRPLGHGRFSAEPYSGWAKNYAQFRHQWVGLTITPKASVEVEEETPQRQARNVVVDIATVPGDALQGELEVDLQVRPLLRERVFRTEAMPAWLKQWQSVMLLGAKYRVPPSFDKGLGWLAVQETLVGVLREPSIELKPDGSGYRLIMDTSRFAALEAAYRDELKLYIDDSSGGFKSVYRATVKLRLQLRRRMGAAPETYTLPVPGSPQDSSGGHGYVIAQRLVC